MVEPDVVTSSSQASVKRKDEQRLWRLKQDEQANLRLSTASNQEGPFPTYVVQSSTFYLSFDSSCSLFSCAAIIGRINTPDLDVVYANTQNAGTPLSKPVDYQNAGTNRFPRMRPTCCHACGRWNLCSV